MVEAAGRPYDIGVQVGKQCKEDVRSFLDFVLDGISLTKDLVLGRTLRFVPMFERYAADLLDEVRGLSDGAGISFPEALLLQLRQEVLGLSEEGCTTFAFSGDATLDGSTIVGQNSDMPRGFRDFLMLLILSPAGSPAVAMVTFPGLMGYHGINSVGVGQFANSLAGPSWRLGLTHYPFKRRLLQQTSLEECIKVFENIPLCSPANYIVSEQGGKAMDVEVVPGSFDILDIGRGVQFHTNHFLSRRFAPQDALPFPDSGPRYERLKNLVSSAFGTISVGSVKTMMQDHAGAPASICRHGGTGEIETVFSIIAQPETGVIHVSLGNPCSNPYGTYEVFGQGCSRW